VTLVSLWTIQNCLMIIDFNRSLIGAYTDIHFYWLMVAKDRLDRISRSERKIYGLKFRYRLGTTNSCMAVMEGGDR